MKDTVMFEDAYFDEKGAWFSASTHNGLYYWDFEEDTVRFMGLFPNEPINGIRLYSKVICYKNCLVFVPVFAKEIVEYDMITGKFKEIEFPKKEKISINKFVGVVQVDYFIYLFSLYGANIYQYDMQLGQIKIMKEWCELIEPYLGDECESIFSFAYAKKDKDKIFLPCYYRNIVFIFDLKNCEHEVKFLDKGLEEGICNIEIYNNEIYLFSTINNRLYRYNYDLSSYKIIYYEKELVPGCICSIVNENNMYFIDVLSAKLFQINLESSEVVLQKQFQMPNKVEYLERIYPYTGFRFFLNGKIASCPMGTNYLLEISQEGINEIKIPDVENKTDIFMMSNSVEIWKELGYCSLKGYQLWISNKETYNMQIEAEKFGKEIYQILK